MKTFPPSKFSILSFFDMTNRKSQKRNLTLTLVQMRSTDSVESNFQQIKDLFSKNPEAFPSDLTVLPENSLFMKIKSREESLSLKDPVFLKLKNLCALYKTSILLTTLIKEKDEVFNTTVFISPKNPVKALYRKIHLFDTRLEGGRNLQESRHIRPGNHPALTTFHGWKIGLSICYDLRFAELYSFYAKKSADILLIPSAFLKTTGKKHWHILLRARAIESQCYVAAPAQSGRHQSLRDETAKRWTYGHSLVISPSGEILLDMKKKAPTLKTLRLSLSSIRNIRSILPMSKHRRLRVPAP